jgi:sarcosine oxidase subunit gamma
VVEVWEPIRRAQVRVSSSGGEAIRLTDASDLAKVIIRGGPGTNVVTQLSGVPIGSSVVRGQVRIGHVRPDQWLYLGPKDAVAAAIADLELSGHTAVTDVTHGRAALRLIGSRTRDLLERVCSLDFSDAMFPDEAMATAPIVGVRCDIIRDDVDRSRSFLVVFDRSYAEYLVGALSEVLQEFV